LREERVKKLERSLESLADVPGQLTRLDERVERIDARTERIEGHVTNVESQISQLRIDMRVGFSAASREMGGTRDAILEVIDSSSKGTQKLYDEGREQMRKLFGDLKSEVKSDIAQTRTDMRVLHEDLVSRISLINRG
jgi:predicted  nucleic acid-binding Zn-ribbon protein